MITEFYFGTSWLWPLPYLPRVMLSYNFCRTRKKPWTIEKPFMMDSGAYSVIATYGKYPYTVEEYSKGIDLWNPDIAWTMDYPCEIGVREKGKYTIKEAQSLTIDNTIKLMDLNEGISMVVQGYEVQDYIEHIDTIKDQGLLTERMGIGTICRRGQLREITRVINAVRNNLPSWVKLHGFGVKYSILQTDSKFALFSADSQSWDYENRYHDWITGHYRGQTKIEKIPRLIEYVHKIEGLLSPRDPLGIMEVNYGSL